MHYILPCKIVGSFRSRKTVSRVWLNPLYFWRKAGEHPIAEGCLPLDYISVLHSSQKRLTTSFWFLQDFLWLPVTNCVSLKLVLTSILSKESKSSWIKKHPLWKKVNSLKQNYEIIRRKYSRINQVKQRYSHWTGTSVQMDFPERESRIWPRQHSRSKNLAVDRAFADASGILFLHLRLGECSIITIAAFTSGVGIHCARMYPSDPTQNKFWLCDLGGVAVVKIGEFLCDPGRSGWK